MIRAVVFDLGKVLSDPPELFERPSVALGVDASAFEALYWTGRREYDEGGSDAAYWGPLVTGLGLPATADRVELLARTDAELWCEIRPSALALVHRVRAAGLLTAILSNAPTRLGLELLTVPWREAVDQWFVSAELGLTKPDPAIYHLVTDTLALAPEQIAFIDDRLPNVEAALAHGWSAHLWVDDADTAAWLDALLPSGPERRFDGGVGFLDRALLTADDHG